MTDDRGMLHILRDIDRKVDDMSAGLEALQTQVSALTAEDTVLTEAVTGATEAFATAEKEIEELKSGGQVTDTELEPITAAIAAGVASTTAAVEKLKTV